MANGMKDLLFIVKRKRVICRQNKRQKSTFTLCKLLVFGSLLLLPACVPCCYYKRGFVVEDYVTLVYRNHQGCTGQGKCGRIRVYVPNLSKGIDTLCVSKQSSTPFGTDCHVTLYEILGKGTFDQERRSWYAVVHIEGTSVWDTLYGSFVEDPCDKGQFLQPLLRGRYRSWHNINGKWYEGRVIYR